MNPSDPSAPEHFQNRWHDSPRKLAAALREASPRAGLVFTFNLPPGLLGGLYAACFIDREGTVHRCLTPYVEAALIQWETRSLQEAARELGLKEVDGRVEIGRNTGDLLLYFLPRADEGEPASKEAKQRQVSHAAWVRAVRGEPPGCVTLRVVRTPDPHPVLCASSARAHFLIRGERRGERSPHAMAAALAVPAPKELPQSSPLALDVMGEWVGE